MTKPPSPDQPAQPPGGGVRLATPDSRLQLEVQRIGSGVAVGRIESSGGKYLRNNNVFGWNSCRTRFPSVRAGIGIVASELGRSNIYKDKPLDQVLRTYNPYPNYGKRVKAVMRTIGGPALALN